MGLATWFQVGLLKQTYPYRILVFSGSVVNVPSVTDVTQDSEVLMEKLSCATTARTALVSLLLLIFLGLSGCAGVGGVVSVNNRILFDGRETGQGRFDQGGLTVVYNYRLVGTNITVDGEVSYLGGVDLLNVWLLFFDTAGSVIRQKIVYSSGYRVDMSWTTERTFHETSAVPPGTAGISFSYLVEPRRNYR